MSGGATTTYELRVDGHLDDHWADWLDADSVVHNGDNSSTFLLTVADQAQLYGTLARLRDIGVTLLSLEMVRHPGSAASPLNPGPLDWRGSNPGRDKRT